MRSPRRRRADSVVVSSLNRSMLIGRFASSRMMRHGSSYAAMTYSRETPRVLLGVARVRGERPARALEHRVEAPVAARQVVGLLFPQRDAVLAPEARQRPARQRLARIPLALAEMQQSAGRELGAQPV